MSRLLDDAYWGTPTVSLSTLSADVDSSELEDTDVDGGETIEGYEDVDSEVETSEGSSGEESVLEDSEELNTELLDVQEDVSEIEQEEENAEADVEAAVAVENFLANLFWTKEQGGLTVQHTDLAVEHVRVIADKIGMPYEYAPDLEFSTESFATVGGVQMNTEGAIESIKDFFVKILDSILKGIAFIMEKGSQMMSKLFGNYEKLREYMKKVKEKLQKAGSQPAKNNSTYKSAGHRLTLQIGGKVETVPKCVQAIWQVAQQISTKWATGKLGTVGTRVGGNVLDSLEDIERVVDKGLERLDRSKVKSDSSSKKMFLAFMQATKDIETSIPIFSNSITSQEAKRCGVTLADGQKAYRSELLPKNKTIVTVTSRLEGGGNGDFYLGSDAASGSHSGKKNEKGVRFYSKLTNYKAENKGGSIEIKVENKADLLSALNTLEKLFDTMEHVKKLIDSAKPIASKLKGIVWKMRLKYIAISKKAREGRDFMDNLRATRRNVVFMKDIINLLREPGASFSAYVLFAGKGLLDVINKHADVLSIKP